MRYASRTAIALLVFALAAPVMAADDDSFLFPRFSGKVGSLFASTDSSVRVEGSGNVSGMTIDLERDLSLKGSQDVGRFSLSWRPFARHEFSLGYFGLSRDASRTLSREIDFGDTVFPIEASVKASAKVEFVDFTYTWWAVRQERFGWGLSLGATMISARAKLTGQAPNIQTELRAEASTDIPVVLLGTELRYAFLPNLVGAARIGALPDVKLGDYSGSMLAYGVSLDWEIVKHLGIGASWGGYQVNVDVDKSSWKGKLKYDIQGAQAYLRFRI